jgi:hypothetical protein
MSAQVDRPVVVADTRQRFSVILPGTWASVPMADAETMRTTVARIVKERMPRDDRLAALRRDVREDLLASAKSAAESGADLYALSLEILPGIPFPASMIGFVQPWPPTSVDAVSAAGSAEEVVELLVAAFPGSAAMSTATVPHVRRADVRLRAVGETETQVLDLEYWFADPTGSLTCLMVSVPECDAPDLVTALFDAVAASVFWTLPDAPEGAS